MRSLRTLQQQLREKGLTDGAEPVVEKSNVKTSIKSKEWLSPQDLADLMGSNRDTFRRAKGGAIRRNR